MLDTRSKALAFAIKTAGRFVANEDPNDATNHGVTGRAYNDWRVSRGEAPRGVQFFSDAEFSTFLMETAWTPMDLDTIPYPLDFVMLDTTAHHGVNTARRWLNDVRGAMDTAPMSAAMLLLNKREGQFRAAAARSARAGGALRGNLARTAALRVAVGLPA